MQAFRSTSLTTVVLKWLTAFILTTVAANVAAEIVLPSERAEELRPRLLILGTAHFNNPGQDLINIEVEDVLSEHRQAEIEHLVERLAQFQPTHIAVEIAVSAQERLDLRYQEYLRGNLALGRSEMDQIGLRLAARMGLERVHAVDWNDYPPGDWEYYNWLEWGEANGFADWIAAIRDLHRRRGVVELGQQSITDWLRELNDPDTLARSHRGYYDFVLIGDDQHHPGANWVGHWHARNLRIFANLVRLSDGPEARILAVYGQGHAYLLQRFAQESGAFRLVDVEVVLGEDS